MSIWHVSDVKENPDGSWSIKYKKGENSLQHNHGPEGNIAYHRLYERDQYLIDEFQSHARMSITPA